MVRIVSMLLFILAVILTMLFLAKRRQKMLAEKRKMNRRKTQRNSKTAENEFIGNNSFLCIKCPY